MAEDVALQELVTDGEIERSLARFNQMNKKIARWTKEHQKRLALRDENNAKYEFACTFFNAARKWTGLPASVLAQMTNTELKDLALHLDHIALKRQWPKWCLWLIPIVGLLIPFWIRHLGYPLCYAYPSDYEYMKHRYGEDFLPIYEIRSRIGMFSF